MGLQESEEEGPKIATLRTHPDEWNEVLSALNNNNIDLAHKLVIAYNFDKDPRGIIDDPNRKKKKQKKYTYHCQTPEGDISTFKNRTEAAKYLGVSPANVTTRIGQEAYEWKIGKMKGWKVWRVEIN